VRPRAIPSLPAPASALHTDYTRLTPEQVADLRRKPEALAAAAATVTAGGVHDIEQLLTRT
jgi:hypothetical protein